MNAKPRTRTPLLLVAALVLGLGGTATAAATITGAQIKNGTVTGKDVKDRSLSAADLAPGTILRAYRHGLFPILCVGETLAERKREQTEEVIRRQLDAGLDGVASQDMKTLTVAYEPVWAIGTGQAAGVEQAAEVHRQIRSVIGGKAAGAESLRILYGGSVTAQNIGDFLSSREIDGALVGGACLDPEVFAKIIRVAAEKS